MNDEQTVQELKRDWEALAARDPFWAVASQSGRHATDSGAWSDDEFFRTGEAEVAELVEKLGLPSEGDFLEIGCGPGRLAVPFASRYSRVTGLDISEHMIQLARAHHGKQNLDFIVGDGASIPVPDVSLDVVFSYHCFQHIPREAVTAYLRDLSRCLRPGGRAYLHVLTDDAFAAHIAGKSAWRRLARHLPWRHGVADWLERLGFIRLATTVHPRMVMNPLPKPWVERSVREFGLQFERWLDVRAERTPAEVACWFAVVRR